jgi:hypothetical protein
VSQTVRRDRSGVTTSALERSIHQGRELVSWGQELDDDAAFGCWCEARGRWTLRTTRVLVRQFEPEAVQEFMRNDIAAGEGWQQRAQHSVRALQDAVELLQALTSSLRG